MYTCCSNLCCTRSTIVLFLPSTCYLHAWDLKDILAEDRILSLCMRPPLDFALSEEERQVGVHLTPEPWISTYRDSKTTGVLALWTHAPTWRTTVSTEAIARRAQGSGAAPSRRPEQSHPLTFPTSLSLSPCTPSWRHPPPPPSSCSFTAFHRHASPCHQHPRLRPQGSSGWGAHCCSNCCPLDISPMLA